MTFIGICVGVIGAALIVAAWRQLKRLESAPGWPVADGKVLRAEVTRDDEGHFLPSVQYEYTAQGQAHIGSTISLGGRWGTNISRTLAARVVGKYPAGSQVRVIFNPDVPGESCLEPTGWIPLIFVMAVGAVLFLTGLGVAIL